MLNLVEQIETLRLADIIYCRTELDYENNKNEIKNKTLSIFDPKNKPCEKSLNIILKSDYKFPANLTFKLTLVAIRDINRNIIKINPIKTKSYSSHKTYNISFKFTDIDIPLPYNIGCIFPVKDPSNNPCKIKPERIMGNALEYCFILNIKDCNTDELPITIPLYARYIGSDTICDFKCEKFDYVCAPEEGYTDELTLCHNTIYSKPIHCVTHCQAPRPLLFVYNNI